jgi:hypothetical protein
MSDKPKETGKGLRHSLSDGDMVTRRFYGRRKALTAIGAGVVGAAALATGVRPARADPLGDADRFSDVVNPDPSPDSDGMTRPSDPKDADRTIPGDAGDGDQTTMADPKIQAEAPDSDGSFGDPKDTDTTAYGDSGDSD